MKKSANYLCVSMMALSGAFALPAFAADLEVDSDYSSESSDQLDEISSYDSEVESSASEGKTLATKVLDALDDTELTVNQAEASLTSIQGLSDVYSWKGTYNCSATFYNADETYSTYTGTYSDSFTTSSVPGSKTTISVSSSDIPDLSSYTTAYDDTEALCESNGGTWASSGTTETREPTSGYYYNRTKGSYYYWNFSALYGQLYIYWNGVEVYESAIGGGQSAANAGYLTIGDYTYYAGSFVDVESPTWYHYNYYKVYRVKNTASEASCTFPSSVDTSTLQYATASCTLDSVNFYDD